MPIIRPPLLKLGGQEAFAAYQAEFDRQYSRGLEDVLGRLVEFPSDACEHICFVASSAGGARTVWVQDRAERILWIRAALTDPGTQVRPSHQFPGREVYILDVDADPAAGAARERYAVVAEPVAPPQRWRLVTAFVMEERYWQATKRAGLHYPRPERRPTRKRR